MRSKQYFTSIKNNPHEISTDPIDGADEALMNRCAVGLQYGVGFELGYKYLLNLTGQYGFTNMFKKSLTQENNKNLAFMITVGYRF